MLKTRHKFGKYRIERRIARGGFADVYKAYDTVEGIAVAVKVPHGSLVSDEALEDFRKEVRVTAKLDHPNILPIKNASFIDGHFAIISPLGICTLADRMKRRMSLKTALDYSRQILSALAHAHERRIIHCDVKPENFILFQDNRLRLTDFGIAKFALRTLPASGSGTVGYVAPEQALGKPSFRSDVFSVGLIFYEMLAGSRPEWPFDWPPPGFSRLRSKVRPDFIKFLRRSIEVDSRKRFENASRMLAAFRRLLPKARAAAAARRRRRNGRNNKEGRHWKQIRLEQFLRRHGRHLEVRTECTKCGGPMSESMQACPWCGKHARVYRGKTRFPTTCPRCHRSMKLDWRFCPWCFGAGFEPVANRNYTDKRYTARCTNQSCPRKVLMPFMRYCPWCRRKVKKKWKIGSTNDKCPSCGWGVLRDYWNHCPWCARALHKR